MQNRRNSLLPDNRNTRAPLDQINHRDSPEVRSERYATASRRASDGRPNLIHSLAAASRERRQLRRGACAWLLLLVLSGLASAQTVDQTDNQVWSDVQVAVPMTKDIDFNILGTLRIGRDVSWQNEESIRMRFKLIFERQ